ncbi:ABC transporter substrate-binding protein [Bartonella bacilliformis]|uniref:ABC transporter substrate-binding protein n=2 Tax=Bartonella bacilliformis TaxID=774 RepID=UPI0018AFB1EF|nr:ABC transporter substrate-binding protein [Bartonella bacilliformis]
MDGSWRMPMIQVWSEKSLRKPGNFYKKQVLLEKITKAIASNSLPLQFEIMTQTPNEEKVALAFQNSLSRLGIDVEIRTVDDTQYQNRLGTFDYDMIIGKLKNSLSPGNEQINR